MSDSDDTDVLLLIPPDLFLVPSSDSEDDLRSCSRTQPGVVTELIGHVQSLESRISAIESRDSSFEIPSQSTLKRLSPSHRVNSHSVSQSTSLQNTPIKPRRCSSVPSTPCSRLLSKKRTNDMRNEGPLCDRSNHHSLKPISSPLWKKHDDLTSLNPAFTCAVRALHVGANTSSPKKESVNNPFVKTYDQLRRSLFVTNSSPKLTGNTSESRKLDDMNLSEVDELLQEMEATELELAKSISASDTYKAAQTDSSSKFNFLKFNNGRKSDGTLQYDDSLHFVDADKLISEFKVWKPMSDEESPDRTKHLFNKNVDHLNKELEDSGAVSNEQRKVQDSRVFKFPDNSNVFGNSSRNGLSNTLPRSKESTKPVEILQTQSLEMFADSLEKQDKVQTDDTQFNFNGMHLNPFQRNNNVDASTDSYLRKSQRLFALSDFWEQDDNKSQEEVLRIKLEEEKFRREHCENLIQELQKKLLEQQEKVAVAIRVDNEKNAAISQFQNSWLKLKQRWQNLESEYSNIQSVLKNSTEKHQSEVTELQAQIKRYEGELSKALDLAAGYKEKSDSMVKEKVDFLRNHSNELEKYKTLAQQVESKCDQIRGDYNKLVEKNQHLEEILKNAQQELNKERLKGGEIKSEMAVIHKALDTCEAELTVLRQEKENLHLKIKEELGRNHILEQSKITLLAALDDAKKAEKLSKDEVRSLAEQQDKMRSELREVYQKQVDEVVRAKQQEFQTQLDSAEMTFQSEFETRQKAIAECAARKIKNVIDKHQLEINLLEEKHKEEKRLCELQLAQMMQKSTMLEAQLNSQQASKNQLVEQLHTVMQRQWQQAFHIIAGENGDNMTSFQRINIDKFFDIKNPINSDAVVNHCTYTCSDPVRLESCTVNGINARGARSREEQNESLLTLTSNDEAPLNSKKDSKNDLRGYIQMILDMQQSKDDLKKSRFVDNSATPPPIYREVPKKHYTKKELSIMSEDSVTWHPVSETSAQDTSEYLSVPQKLNSKEQQKMKPPWK